MLILNRRVGEAVMIFDDITVIVLGMRGGQVRLGFAADPTVPIHREEIHARIQREQASSGASMHTDRPARQRSSPRTNRERRRDTDAPIVSHTDVESVVDE